VKDFPPNSRATFIYPKTGDEEADSDPFRRNLLIRLDDGQFKAYSNVCVHLWCLADYKSERKQIECPCHGSMYNAETGIAFAGPATMQENNALPIVELEIEDNGRIFAIGRKGIVGYGRKEQKA
jgi:ubiquinol-cytochrome c reductase iron-sulfur subunit